MTRETLRVAVVGAGPAGVYASALLRTHADVMGRDVRIDVLESLPSPYGLIRYGVAPDHPRIKGIVDSLHEMLDDDRTRFIGNVTVGRHIAVDELRERYHAIILATGADRDAPTTLPGAHLRGSYGAADFVSWYDGHPDHPRDWNLDAREVAVIGHGNVALDVARILAKSAEQLVPTDMPDNVLNTIARTAATDVHVFGRRGPAQTKFTPIELRELGEIDDVEIVLDEADFAIAEQDPDWVNPRTNQQKIIRRIFESWRGRTVGSAQRRVHVHFWCEPVRVVGETHVEGVTFRRTATGVGAGALPKGREVTHSVQAVYRAVGYRSTPVPGVPFDEARGVIANIDGRVCDSDGRPVPQLYATGWVKRGPVGLIGHTKSDALQTIQALLQDIGDLPEPTVRAADSVIELVQSRGTEAVFWDDWRRLDAHEVASGAGYPGVVRERIKVVDRDEQVHLAKGRTRVGHDQALIA